MASYCLPRLSSRRQNFSASSAIQRIGRSANPENAAFADDYGHAPKTFTSEAIQALQDYNWTGNIRELANVIERLYILCDQVVNDEDVRRYVYPNK